MRLSQIEHLESQTVLNNLIILDKIRTRSEDDAAGADDRKVQLVATKYLGKLAGQELDGIKIDPQATRTPEIVRLL